MTGYKYLLFDLDGTLTRSHYGIYKCIRYALKRMGRPKPKKSQLKKCVGPVLETAFAEVFSLSPADAKRAVELYRERYAVKGLFANKPMPHAKTLLKKLKEHGYKIALATLKPKVFADKISDKFGFSPYFDLMGVATFSKETTKTGVIETLADSFGAKKEECLMIGDRDQDVFGAREAGVDCVVVRSGYAEVGELENSAPLYIFKNLKELERYLLPD